ncbi:unnamed protein product [Parajaminaea phylloscopi]
MWTGLDCRAGRSSKRIGYHSRITGKTLHQTSAICQHRRTSGTAAHGLPRSSWSSMEAGGSNGTPSGSRASSLAPSASQQSIAANGMERLLPGVEGRQQQGFYRPGCKHIKNLSSSELNTVLQHYILGVRWGKRVRRGAVREPEDEEEDSPGHPAHEHEDHQSYSNGWRNGSIHHKRRKLLPHPSCSTCQVSLHKPYLCLTCAYTACLSPPSTASLSQGCIGRHLASNAGHEFAVEIHSGHLYCGACKCGVVDPRFDLAFQEEKGRASGHATSKPLRSPEAENRLKELSAMPDKPLCSRVPRGIHNLGATCFLSVILQSFIHNPILRNYFLADRHNPSLCASSPGSACMACEVDKLFKDFFSHNGPDATSPPTPWTPSSFLYSVWRAQEGSELSQAGQQDSHELFISVLNALHSALTGPGKDPHTRKSDVPRWTNDNDRLPKQEPFHANRLPIDQGQFDGSEDFAPDSQDDDVPDFAARLCDCIVHRTFSGVLQSDVRCLVCGYRSSTHDPVLDLSVDLKPLGTGSVGAHAGNLSASANGSSSAHMSSGPLSKALDDLDNSPSFHDGDQIGVSKKKKGLNGGLGKRDRDSTPMKKAGSKQGNGGPGASSASAAQGKGRASPAVFSNSDADSQDLLDCLRRYCTSERLPPSSYSCPQCGPVEASKQLSLRRLAPVLCIQLKRFEHTGLVAGSGHKIETKVHFPMRLDVREFITPCVLEGGKPAGHRASRRYRTFSSSDGDDDDDDEDGGERGDRQDSPGAGSGPQEQLSIDHFLYSLFCVIVHEGSLNTGHYWCFCKWKGQWYRLNDAEARPVSVREVAMEKAYQLVYVREALENVICP